MFTSICRIRSRVHDPPNFDFTAFADSNKSMQFRRQRNANCFSGGSRSMIVAMVLHQRSARSISFSLIINPLFGTIAILTNVSRQNRSQANIFSTNAPTRFRITPPASFSRASRAFDFTVASFCPLASAISTNVKPSLNSSNTAR